jgi:hypothetical protein
MGKQRDGSPRSAGLSPSEMSLLGDPLDLINHDHLGIRHSCALMDAIFGLPSDEPGGISDARHFLTEDLTELLTHMVQRRGLSRIFGGS